MSDISSRDDGLIKQSSNGDMMHKTSKMFFDLQCVNGIWISTAFKKEDIESALRYEARPDDIFIVTYLRSGTTWMQIIVYTLLTNRSFDLDWVDFESRTPFLEVVGAVGVEQMRRTGTIKTHLPFDRIAYHPMAKYVCVLRNPTDVCLSLYRFFTGGSENNTDMTGFDDYFDAFLQGRVGFGDYFEHLQSVWSHKDKPNVIIILYEDMVSDLRPIIYRLSNSLQIPLDATLIESVMRYGDISHMRENYDKKRLDFYANLRKCNDASLPLSIQKTLAFEIPPDFTTPYIPKKIRHGKIGQGAEWLTREQTNRLEEKLRKTMDGTGFLEYLSEVHAKGWLSSA